MRAGLAPDVSPVPPEISWESGGFLSFQVVHWVGCLPCQLRAAEQARRVEAPWQRGDTCRLI